MGITQIDLARKLGLSQGTVSKILSKCTDAFNPKTVKKVFETAKRLKYNFHKLEHKRQAPRRAISAPCTITICSSKGENLVSGSGKVEDISITGALISDIKLPESKFPASKFLMKIEFTGGPLKGMQLTSVPVRYAVEKDKFAIANKFIQRTRKDRIRITKFVKGTLKTPETE